MAAPAVRLPAALVARSRASAAAPAASQVAAAPAHHVGTLTPPRSNAPSAPASPRLAGKQRHAGPGSLGRRVIHSFSVSLPAGSDDTTAIISASGANAPAAAALGTRHASVLAVVAAYASRLTYDEPSADDVELGGHRCSLLVADLSLVPVNMEVPSGSSLLALREFAVPGSREKTSTASLATVLASLQSCTVSPLPSQAHSTGMAPSSTNPSSSSSSTADAHNFAVLLLPEAASASSIAGLSAEDSERLPGIAIVAQPSSSGPRMLQMSLVAGPEADPSPALATSFELFVRAAFASEKAYAQTPIMDLPVWTETIATVARASSFASDHDSHDVEDRAINGADGRQESCRRVEEAAQLPLPSLLRRRYANSDGNNNEDDDATRSPWVWNLTAERDADGNERYTPRPALSHRQLHSQAMVVAAALRRRLTSDITPTPPPVAVLAERSHHLVLGPLAVWYSGAVYLPLEPAIPVDRAAGYIEDARAPILLASRSLRAHADAVAQASGVTVVTIEDALAEEAADQAQATVTDEPSPSQLAYIIFTSGSTGKPKGVMVTHANMSSFLAQVDAYLSSIAATVSGSSASSPSSRRYLAMALPTFDISILELFLPLYSGQSCLVAPRSLAFDPAAVGRLLADGFVDVFQATPATFSLMAEVLPESWRAAPRTVVITGGEALNLEMARWLSNAFDAVLNMYAPTEVTVYTTSKIISLRAAGQTAKSFDGKVTIGRPFPGEFVAVVDKKLRPVPPGVEGELVIGGVGVTRGYLNREDVTKKAFVYDAESELTVYRTGDLGRQTLVAGRVEIEHFGRIDRQVKMRGYRIELGEIEVAVRESATEVEDKDARLRAVVVALHAATSTLSAFLIPEDAGSVAWTPGSATHGLALAVAEKVRARLPAYMVPSGYAVMSRFPLTANGKVDHHALHSLPLHPFPRGDDAASSRESSEEDVEATDVERELEAAIVEVYAQVLSSKGARKVNVGPRDDFFAMGATSLLAIRAIAAISRLPMLTGVPELPMSLLTAAGGSSARAVSRALAKKITRTTAESGSANVEQDSVMLEAIDESNFAEFTDLAGGSFSLSEPLAVARAVPAEVITGFLRELPLEIVRASFLAREKSGRAVGFVLALDAFMERAGPPPPDASSGADEAAPADAQEGGPPPEMVPIFAFLEGLDALDDQPAPTEPGQVLHILMLGAVSGDSDEGLGGATRVSMAARLHEACVTEARRLGYVRCFAECTHAFTAAMDVDRYHGRVVASLDPREFAWEDGTRPFASVEEIHCPSLLVEHIL